MEEAPPRDGTFQPVPSATPGLWDFKVAVNYGTPRPGSKISPGTRYDAITNEQMFPRPNVDIWGSYVAAQSEPAGTRVLWQFFVPSLPTTPTVVERIDTVWGRVYDHTYLDLDTNSKPDRADDFSTSPTVQTRTMSDGSTRTLSSGQSRTLTSTRKVLDVKTSDLGQGLCRVIVTTASNEVVTQQDEILDEASGVMLPVTRTLTLATTKPAAAGIDTITGLFTDVRQQEYRIWAGSTRKLSGLPASRAEAQPWTTMGNIYWPAVLAGYSITAVLDSSGNWERLLAYSLQEPHAGAVRVTKRRWMQYTPPSVSAPVNLIPTAISIRARDTSISIPDCLHSSFQFDEYQAQIVPPAEGWVSPSTDYLYGQMVTWSVSATPYTRLPSTLVRLDVEYQNGAWMCIESIYEAPTDVVINSVTVSTRPATSAEISTANV